MIKITIYGTESCTNCKSAEKWLSGLGYEVEKITDSAVVRAVCEKLGVISVPIIQVGEEYVVGFGDGIKIKLIDMLMKK